MINKIKKLFKPKVPKLCIDCKYCIPNPNFPENLSFYNCVCPMERSINFVDGTVALTGWTYCTTHRVDNWFACRVLKTCGKEGRWFEKK